MIGATLDHVVIDTRNRIDEAAATFAGLGFQLTPRGHHTLGSSNNLAIFRTNYLELLGFGVEGAARQDLNAFPEGLNGLVFKTVDAAATAQHAQAAGIPAGDAMRFSRPVKLDEIQGDASFRTTHLPPETSGIGRVYFCEHLTPDLVWRPAWQVHPNGAQNVVRVYAAAPDPTRQATLFAGLFGAASVSSEADGSVKLTLQDGAIVVVRPPDATLNALGSAAPHPAGRPGFLAGFVLRVADLAATARLLRGVPGLITAAHRVVIPAAAAFNTTIIFEDSYVG